eukprot:TRINITY_DN15714_c0_g1_i1.p1 TRINITY_DN15714_c0_g1~~TRINITY_DN15714_c0_g1_i1.p1  ORF type:complete len:1090 (+),score=222.13 TRINITY_DN15714_c0_g1_i1:74-3343(+)
MLALSAHDPLSESNSSPLGCRSTTAVEEVDYAFPVDQELSADLAAVHGLACRVAEAHLAHQDGADRPRGAEPLASRELLERVAAECASRGTRFVDLAFPPGEGAVWGAGQWGPAPAVFREAKPDIGWARPLPTCAAAGKLRLFAEGALGAPAASAEPPRRVLSPEWLGDGTLGDVGFAAAVAALCEREQLVRSLFPPRPRPAAGAAAARLRPGAPAGRPAGEGRRGGSWSARIAHGGWWDWWVVDEALPLLEEAGDTRPELRLAASDGCGRGAFLSSRYDAREMWPAVLQKVYAKAEGCYAALWAASPAQVLGDLTGAPVASLDWGAGLEQLHHCLAEHESWGDLMWVARKAKSSGGQPRLREAASVLRAVRWRDELLVELRGRGGAGAALAARGRRRAFDDSDLVWESSAELSALAGRRSGARADRWWMRMQDLVKEYDQGGACLVRADWEDLRLRVPLVPSEDGCSGEPGVVLRLLPSEDTLALLSARFPGRATAAAGQPRLLVAVQREDSEDCDLVADSWQPPAGIARCAHDCVVAWPARAAGGPRPILLCAGRRYFVWASTAAAPTEAAEALLALHAEREMEITPVLCTSAMACAIRCGDFLPGFLGGGEAAVGAHEVRAQLGKRELATSAESFAAALAQARRPPAGSAPAVAQRLLRDRRLLQDAGGGYRPGGGAVLMQDVSFRSGIQVPRGTLAEVTRVPGPGGRPCELRLGDLVWEPQEGEAAPAAAPLPPPLHPVSEAGWVDSPTRRGALALRTLSFQSGEVLPQGVTVRVPRIAAGTALCADAGRQWEVPECELSPCDLAAPPRLAPRSSVPYREAPFAVLQQVRLVVGARFGGGLPLPAGTVGVVTSVPGAQGSPCEVRARGLLFDALPGQVEPAPPLPPEAAEAGADRALRLMRPETAAGLLDPAEPERRAAAAVQRGLASLEPDDPLDRARRPRRAELWRRFARGVGPTTPAQAVLIASALYDALGVSRPPDIELAEAGVKLRRRCGVASSSTLPAVEIAAFLEELSPFEGAASSRAPLRLLLDTARSTAAAGAGAAVAMRRAEKLKHAQGLSLDLIAELRRPIPKTQPPSADMICA